MNKGLQISAFLLAIFVSIIVPFQGAIGILVCTAIALLVIYSIGYVFEGKESIYIRDLFLVALLLRVLFATVIYVMNWESILGPDAYTIDARAYRISGYWNELLTLDDYGVEDALSFTYPGWGMFYLAGIFYYLFGRSPFVVQLFGVAVSSASVPAAYYCASKIFANGRVARYSALAVAFVPAMVLWSSQLLKDGLIVFFLVFSMALVIRLLEEFDYRAILLLTLSLFAILSLRFYVFYMVVAAVVGSFIVGSGDSSQSAIKRFLILVVLGIGITYAGAAGSAGEALDTHSDMENRLAAREWAATTSNAGFGADYDLETTEGVVTLLPVGIVFILFAPFPWQIAGTGQLVALPDLLIWWGCTPFLISGLWYTVKNRFRKSLAIITFSTMLTCVYAIFQGNYGTAYRQRTQIQVFLFMFVAVGIALYQERKENRL